MTVKNNIANYPLGWKAAVWRGGKISPVENQTRWSEREREETGAGRKIEITYTYTHIFLIKNL